MIKMKTFIRCFLALVVIAGIAAQQQDRTECCEEYCYGSDSERPQSKSFGAKSVYQIARGVDMSRHSVIPNCEPVKFWLLGRNGAPLPQARDMQKLKTLIDLRDQVIENYELRRSKPDVGYLCDADYNIIKNWRWDSNITGNFDQFLTVQGYNDEKFMAKQFQRILPNVLENIYTPDRFKFRHLPSQRAEASFKGFVEGLFGDGAATHIRAELSSNNDSLLNPELSCPLYQKNLRALENPDSEVNKFIASSTYKDMLREVSTRLGFRLVLSPTQVDLIWDMCRFEQAWYIEMLSPWCAAFTKSHVAVLEYKEDLVNYYKNGYGNAVNEHLACTAMKDMLKHMETRGSGPRVVASFAHSDAVQLLVAALGVFRDTQPLRADNFYQQKRRQFHTSRINPFSSNLVAIGYDCEQEAERKKVMFFLNEKPLELDWCRVGLCDWTKVEEHYKKYLAGIDCAREYCQESGAGQVKYSAFAFVLLVGVFIKSMFL